MLPSRVMIPSDDHRNVADIFKGWETDLIKQSIAENTNGFAVAMFQIDGDFNFGTVVRNANWYGAEAVFHIGKKRWDKRSAVGTHHYTHVDHYPDWDTFYDEVAQDFTIVALEQAENAWSLDRHFQWPKRPMIIVGEENSGIPADELKQCDVVVEIPGYGSVRSLNAGCASGIAMHDFTSKL